jgi:hypothetical protein
MLHRASDLDEIHIWERQDMRTKFLSDNLMGKEHLEDLGVDRMPYKNGS